MENKEINIHGLISDLKKPIPYQWRLGPVSSSAKGSWVTCLAYIDARDVMDTLDGVVGPQNWQSEFYQVGSNTYCKIGIKINGEWVWKSDTGSESDVEKEKGLASDCFKRSAVQWGIGRFLYDMGLTMFPCLVENMVNGKRKIKIIHDSQKYQNINQKLLREGFVNEYKLTEYINATKSLATR